MIVLTANFSHARGLTYIMLFNSLEFLVFLPIAFALYFALPAKYRWVFLIIASYYFYVCWKVSYVYLLIISTLTDYTCGRKIEASDNPKTRKRYLYISLVINLGLLFTYKYFDFFNNSLRALFESMGLNYGIENLNLTLPVGISFYTFQTLGYTIDVYKRRIQAEPNLYRFALYVTYFPQLVAGPIERAKNLIPQLRQHYDFDYERVRDGLALILWGLFKKVVIADRLADYTNTVFADPGAHQGMQIWIADYFFAIQLMCDFSGYTDIAIGTALVMGVRLMQNFRQPLLSENIGDFWSRWHISLTTWFRDYLFVLVGGRRGNRSRMFVGIMVVFLVNGLWHGSNWTFACFGLLHGIALVLYYQTRPVIKRAYRAAGMDKHPLWSWIPGAVITHLIVILGSNFFRAQSIGDSMTLFSRMFTRGGTDTGLNLFTYPGDLWLSIALLVILYASEGIGQRYGYKEWLNARPVAVRWLLLLAGIGSVMFLGKWDAVNFIYFQF